jgi:hypothetical protein
MSPLPGGFIAPAQLVKRIGDNQAILPNGGIILTSFAPEVDNVGGDFLDIDVTSTSSNGVWVYLDFNRHSSFALPPPRYMNVATFSIVQFSPAENIKERQAPVLPNLDDLRYRCRRLPASDPLDGSTFMQFTPINEWSAWRGGNPGAPLQRDSNFYNFFSGQFGTKSGAFEYQLEQPDGSGIIISQLVVRLKLTKV